METDLPAVFITTQWSVVAAAGDSRHPEAAAAVDRLCRDYWRPLYGFVRRTGRTHDEALDLTQGFFAGLLQKRSWAMADPDRGRFRSFLLGSLKHFLAHEHERAIAAKRGGGNEPVPWDGFDDEVRDALEPSDGRTPEVVFDQRWATQQIDRVVKNLREEYALAGKAALFDLLKGYVWGERNTLTLSEIADQLDLTEEAVKKAVQRLRQRLRDSLRAEIARTVTTPDQIDDELRHLRAALAAGG